MSTPAMGDADMHGADRNGEALVTPAASNWYEANQTYLSAALGQVRQALERYAAREQDRSPAEETKPAPETPDRATWSLPVAPALDSLSSAFGLTPFERKVLLMCAGLELDHHFAPLFAAAHNDPRRPQPTFSLALAAFDDAHWSALSPTAPLRYWRLVELTGGDGLAMNPLRIDERILHYLAGVDCLEERLRPLLKEVSVTGVLAPSQLAVARDVAAAWSQAAGRSALPIIHLCGDDAAAKRDVAAAACAGIGWRLYAIPARHLPNGAGEFDGLLRLWEREANLSASALLIECDDAEGADDFPLKWLTESARTPVLIAKRDLRKGGGRSVVPFTVHKPMAAEQSEIWRSALSTAASACNGAVEALVSQFNLSSTSIRTAAAQTLYGYQPGGTPESEGQPSPGDRPSRDALYQRLWDACRAQAQPPIEGLAQKIESAATWDDLVLPEPQRQTLREIAAHVRQRAKVYQTWGFASKGGRGLGISVLFAGPSGTGKTMAGEVLARELRLDLYHIDLSQVVSKYIGETEKNLSRVFNAADEGGAILLFDEADALFGKRSEVKDSHDRYANVEISYLLQRMEAYRGLAILTTNRKSAVDSAFLRRIRFVVDFPFPDAAQRAEIWRRVFPRDTPVEGLRIDKLARLSAAGGNIRNIALGAAFLAADSGEPVGMRHLLRAARSEFAKLERPLSESETGGWV